jgi:hypothetical protein
VDLSDRAFELYEEGKEADEIAAELGLDLRQVMELVFEALQRRGRLDDLLETVANPPIPPPAPPAGSPTVSPPLDPDEWVIVERDPDPDVLEEEGESYLYVEFTDMVSNQHELIEGVARYLATLPSVEKAWREDTELILVQAPLSEAEVLAAVKQWWSEHDGPTSWETAG